MNLAGKINIPTNLYSTIPGDPSFVERIMEPGEKVKIIGIKKVGMKKYYNIGGNSYVLTKDVQVIRDMDYYFDNVKSKKLQKTNLSMTGATGIGAILNDDSISNKEGLTDTWLYLDQFSGIGGFLQDVTKTATQMKKLGGVYSRTIPTVGGGFGGGNLPVSNGGIIRYPNTNTGSTNGIAVSNGGIYNYPTSSGTRTSSVLNPSEYQSAANNMIASTLGGFGININKNSTAGKLLNGLTVGSIFDGSFLGGIIDNALAMIGQWFLDKLSYVLGFDVEALLSALFDLFGVNWERVFEGDFSSFLQEPGLDWGSGGNSWNHSSEKYDPYYTHSGYGIKWFNVYAGQGDLWEFHYAEVTQAMKDFFKYRGCDGATIVKHFGDLTWEQDASYATPELEPHKDEQEVEVWKTLWDADYSDFTDSIDLIHNEFNISVDRLSIVQNFNRFRVPTIDNELQATRGYIFFTRPDLNLNAELDGVAGVARISPMFDNMLKSHTVLISYLMGDAPSVAHEFIPIFTHACTGLDVADEVLETVETGNTYTGWKYMYGTSLTKSKSGGTVNVSFTDDDMLSVYKMIKVWCEYIHAVYRGETEPHEQYMKYNQLDYAISIYYFLCKATSENEILFWTKYTGCFPTAIPSSNFSDQIGTVIRRPEYSVPFAFARKDDFNPLSIVEFNNLSTNDFTYMPAYNEETLRMNSSFVGAPFVDTNDGSRLFKLKFRPRGY